MRPLIRTFEAGGCGGGKRRRRLQLAVDFATMANEPSLHLLKANRGFIPAFCHGSQIMEVFQQTPIAAEGKDHAFPCAFGISHISFFNDAHKPSSGKLFPKITTLSRLNSLLLDTGPGDSFNGGDWLAFRGVPVPVCDPMEGRRVPRPSFFSGVTVRRSPCPIDQTVRTAEC